MFDRTHVTWLHLGGYTMAFWLYKLACTGGTGTQLYDDSVRKEKL
jgi:hypothetical protein